MMSYYFSVYSRTFTSFFYYEGVDTFALFLLKIGMASNPHATAMARNLKSEPSC